MKLPKRSRTHQIEELSVDKFKSLLPVAWVYRIPTHDYGIDGEVEIFDDEGYSTGKKFLVQLKATDECDLKKALKLRLSIEKFNYYRQLEQPILIVRYMANVDDIYVRWFHSVNPVEDTMAEKSFCIKFQKKHLWCENKLAIVTSELETYFVLSNHPLHKPIAIDAVVSSDSDLSIYTPQLATKLIRSGEIGESVFSFCVGSDISKNPVFVEFFENEYHISLGGVASLRSNFDPPKTGEDVDIIVANVNISLAILLQRLGHSGESENLFDAFLTTSSIGESELSLSSYVGAKARTNKIGDALEYLVSISENGALERDELKNLIQIVMALVTRIASKKDERKIESTYLALIEESHTIDSIFTSVLHYNLGNFLSNRCRNRDAIRQYINAAKLNPDYKLRSYWKRELAGLFFDIGKFRRATALYEGVLEDNPSVEIRGLFADSLMFSGFFKRALNEFESTLSTLEKNNQEWCLKHWCLEQIVHELGVEAQVVGPYAGIEFIKRASEETAIGYLKTTNSLCPDCWFFVGTKLAERSEFEGATVCFLLSAFSDEKYKDAWMRSLQCSFGSKDSVIAHHIMLVVSQKFGSEAISDFFYSLDNSNDPKLHEIALQVIQACEESNNERKQKGIELRFGDSQVQKSINL